jgi:hypothetical protein
MYTPSDAILKRIVQHVAPKASLLAVAKQEATRIPEMSLPAFAAAKHSIWLVCIVIYIFFYGIFECFCCTVQLNLFVLHS